ncbi:hypothetical protein NQ314_009443 [Rhamnusium bicolor]|uniref:Tyr recombinase domain-containing protein n=1 Tax=Rhamnusium bicolor TaxID=1586634 RepID=A0AAV8XZL9_9CUCU|nr:hypothetical protein NQ314_009443 [Rhamnusium bicolor]
MIAIQIFNRRRAGELERITIDDFNTFQSIDQNSDPELFKSLPEEYRSNAKNYFRLVIRGKKDRGVPVLLSTDIFDSVKLILKFRNEAAVPNKNPYIFGIPGKSLGNSYLRACDLMRTFAKESGISNDSLMRGTQLRNQLATQSATLDLNEGEVNDLANFLGHAEKIHREHYKIPVVSREIGRISRLLEMGIGKNVTNEKNMSTGSSLGMKIKFY